ncbi:MAG: DUF1073 domain-containing protein [Sphingomonadaceae bacterium]|nr:DUF1073 domain-containing protein [Sphingomonadaceae bacterium]
MGNVLRLFDGLKNAITGAGTRRDARTASTYAPVLPLTQPEIDAAYRGSGLMRKIIQIPALDMVREWRDWKIDADLVTKIEDEEKRLGLQAKIRQAEVLRGLGGGALILGLPGDPSQPAPANIGLGQLSFVNVVSRWHLSFSAMQDDARLPGYGEPLMWQLNTGGTAMMNIHPSRVVPFRADTTAMLAALTVGRDDAFWGESRVAQVLDAVQDSDAARGAFASLLHKARLTRIGIPGLSALVAAPGGEEAVSARLSVIALAESIHNASVYDSGTDGTNAEKIDDVSYSFAGAKDILSAYAEFVAAISDIPATRLLGRAPEGMNASGDSQQQDWKKRVRAMQTLELAPCLERIDPYLVQSATGARPDAGAWFDFAPLDNPSEKDNADRFAVQVGAIEKLVNMGIMPERALAKGAQSLLIEEGYLPGLEAALEEIPEDERWGVEPDLSLEPDPAPQPKGGDLPAGAEGMDTTDASPRPLYVRRDLLNAADLIAWAKAQGLETTLTAEDMHVTVLYSRTPVDPMAMGETWGSETDGGLIVKVGGPRALECFGEGALVLQFASWSLTSRHADMIRAGASHDWPEYAPHVTIPYTVPDGFDLETVRPYAGELRFGQEIFEPLDLDWKSKIEEA